MIVKKSAGFWNDWHSLPTIKMSTNDDQYERISMRGVQGADDKKMAEILEYWLISAPGEPTLQQAWDTLNRTTSKYHGLTTNFKLHIPDLKVKI